MSLGSMIVLTLPSLSISIHTGLLLELLFLFRIWLIPAQSFFVLALFLAKYSLKCNFLAFLVSFVISFFCCLYFVLSFSLVEGSFSFINCLYVLSLDLMSLSMSIVIHGFALRLARFLENLILSLVHGHLALGWIH